MTGSILWQGPYYGGVHIMTELLFWWSPYSDGIYFMVAHIMIESILWWGPYHLVGNDGKQVGKTGIVGISDV